MHAYLQTFGIEWSQVGGGGELGLAGPCLYYHWASGRIVGVGALQAKFHVMDEDGVPFVAFFKPYISLLWNWCGAFRNNLHSLDPPCHG